MMKIEIMYPELCNLYGDRGNISYFRHCLPNAEFIETNISSQPLFVKEKPDFIYFGSLNEKNQEKMIALLKPYKNRIKELIDSGVPMLFTGNSGEILFEYIELWDNTKIECLNILPFTAKRSQFDRFNGLVLGNFQENFEIIGFRSQFTFWYGDNSENYFIKCIRGIGNNRDSDREGIMINNTIVTSQLGPILPNNPPLTRWLMDTMGANDLPIAFENAVNEAYRVHIEELKNPDVEVES